MESNSGCSYLVRDEKHLDEGLLMMHNRWACLAGARMLSVLIYLTFKLTKHLLFSLSLRQD